MLMPGPRMIEASGFLGAVRDLAPSRGALVQLDHDFATRTGRAPRTLMRAVMRAEARGLVSVKVADALTTYIAPREDRARFRGRCPRCSAFLRSSNPGPYCDPCEGAFR